mgnify:CR=1 FL=1
MGHQIYFDRPLVLLASYPRSGNTLLRTILKNCFNLRSASIYPKDLGGNTLLESYVGHIEGMNRASQSNQKVNLVKTHEMDLYKLIPSIYVSRNGYDVLKSCWSFWDGEISPLDIAAGRYRFGTWSNHVLSWSPWKREKTLWLNYEELIDESAFPKALDKISDFVEIPIVADKIPSRETIVNTDGKWARASNTQKLEITPEINAVFCKYNAQCMKFLGYSLQDINK